jgi:hypothetical protein
MQKLRNSFRSKSKTSFAGLEHLDDNVYISKVWDNITENIKISAKVRLGHYDIKQHKTWFDKERSKL